MKLQNIKQFVNEGKSQVIIIPRTNKAYNTLRNSYKVGYKFKLESDKSNDNISYETSSKKNDADFTAKQLDEAGRETGKTQLFKLA